MIYFYEAQEQTYGCFQAQNDDEAISKMKEIERLTILYRENEEINNEFTTLYRKGRKCIGV